jgi:hypothetical protein
MQESVTEDIHHRQNQRRAGRADVESETDTDRLWNDPRNE